MHRRRRWLAGLAIALLLAGWAAGTIARGTRPRSPEPAVVGGVSDGPLGMLATGGATRGSGPRADTPGDACGANDAAVRDEPDAPDGLDEPPPPDVYTTPDDDRRRRRVLDGPVVVTVRVEHARGAVAPGAGSGRWGGIVGWWSLDRHDDAPPTGSEEARTETGWGGGHVPIDGRVGLTSTELEAWRHATFVVSVDRCEEARVERPSDPVPTEVVVRLATRAALASFAGVVRDDRGRPLGGAGVFLPAAAWGDDASDEPGVRTADDGSFVLATGVEPPIDTDDAPPLLRLVVMAPGFAATSIPVRRGGEQGLDVALAQERADGSLDVRFLTCDGLPAAGARAFLRPVGTAFVDDGGLPTVAEDDARADDRRRLARLVGGSALETQGYAIAQDSTPIEDLCAGDDGYIRVPALPPGRYRVRAVLPARPDLLGPGGVEFGELRLAGAVETEVEVAPPPARSEATVAFPPGRVVEGRISVAVNPTWHCGHDRHRHVVRPHGWPWTSVEVESGAGRTGRFRLEGLPPGALTLRVWTVHHGEVRVEVPPESPGDVARATSVGAAGPRTDVGDLVVPDVRVLFGKVVGDDGQDLSSPTWIGPVTLRGAGAAVTTYLCSDGTFRVALPTPPGEGAELVVGRDRARPDVVRVPWPFDLGAADRPLLVRLPKGVPATEAEPDALPREGAPPAER